MADASQSTNNATAPKSPQNSGAPASSEAISSSPPTTGGAAISAGVNANNASLVPQFPSASAFPPDGVAVSYDDESNLDGAGENDPPQDLTLFVQDLLEQMQSKFDHMGDSLLGRIDDMGSRIDELEKSIADLMDQAGVEPPTGGGLSVAGSGGRVGSSAVGAGMGSGGTGKDASATEE